MVAYRRISPQEAFVQSLIETQERVESLETRPAGNIVVRETLSTQDPDTGVKTVFGELPDGSYGIEPFIYDITPPPVASTPLAVAEPGLFVISWDGTFVGGAAQPRDFVAVNVIGHKIVAGATVSSAPVGRTTAAYSKIYVSTDVVAVGETWEFSLEAEDYSGNRAEWSARSVRLEMKSLATDVAVETALGNLEADVLAAQTAATNAQTAATAAQADADLVAQNLTATDAEVAAAQLKADQAFNVATDAATDAGNAQTSADGKNKNWNQPTAPAGTGHKDGDVWYDTDDGNRIYLWQANLPTPAWVSFQDTAISSASETATAALQSANGKNKIIWSTSVASGTGYAAGDIWFQRDGAGTVIAQWEFTTSWQSRIINEALIGNLSAGKITAGFLDAARIKAGSLSAEKLLISNTSNSLVDPSFLNPTITDYRESVSSGGLAGWTLNTATATTMRFMSRTTATANDVFSFAVSSVAAGTAANHIQVAEGQKWILEVDVETDISAGVRWNIYSFKSDGTVAYTGLSPYSVAVGKRNLSYVYTVPAGVVAASFALACNTTAVAWKVYGNAFVGIQSDATMIQNGAITTTHMTAGTIDAAVLTAGSIKSPMIEAKTIGVDKLTITSTDNLIVGGDMALSAASWPKTANITAQPTAGRGSMPALRFSGLAGAMASVNSSNRVTVEPDNRFRCSISVKSSSALAIDSVRLMIRCFTSPTTSSDVIGVYNTAPLVANTWTQIKGVSYALPANTREVEFYLYVTNPDTTTTTDIDYVAVTRAADGSLIVDGSVTATKLESDLILATKIVAGDPNGTHAEMSPQGFRVYADAAEVGAPSTEVVRLGVANTNDYFAVTKSDGTLAASISQEGVIAGSQVNANSSLYYKGTELTTILKRLPKGNVAYSAYGGINVNNINTNTGIGLFDLGFNAEAGRAYRISGYIRGYLTGGNGQITTQLKYTSGGAAPTINSASLTVDGHSALSDHWNTYYFNKFVHFNAAGGPDAWVRVLLVAGREVGPGVFNVFDSLMSIDDIGLQFNPTGTPNTGGGTTAPAKTNYIKQYGCYNSMNYQGNNAQYNFDTGRMYQGLSPAGYGNLKSIGLFPDMTADLSGASINYIRVYFNFAHWYYNSGGTARIGLHGHTGIPGSFSQAGNIITSTGWPKPGARWLDIDPIHWDNFKTGAYRGVTLEGDGSYVTYGYADRPTIEINYTK